MSSESQKKVVSGDICPEVWLLIFSEQKIWGGLRLTECLMRCGMGGGGLHVWVVRSGLCQRLRLLGVSRRPGVAGTEPCFVGTARAALSQERMCPSHTPQGQSSDQMLPLDFCLLGVRPSLRCVCPGTGISMFLPEGRRSGGELLSTDLGQVSLALPR